MKDSGIPVANIQNNSTFIYPQNELFEFLNSDFGGRIILGKYKHKKILEYGRLKELIILHHIKQDPIDFK